MTGPAKRLALHLDLIGVRRSGTRSRGLLSAVCSRARRRAVRVYAWTFHPGDTVYVIDRASNGDGDVTWTRYFRGRRERTHGDAFWTDRAERADAPALMARRLAQRWWIEVRTALASVRT